MFSFTYIFLTIHDAYAFLNIPFPFHSVVAHFVPSSTAISEYHRTKTLKTPVPYNSSSHNRPVQPQRVGVNTNVHQFQGQRLRRFLKNRHHDGSVVNAWISSDNVVDSVPTVPSA